MGIKTYERLVKKNEIGIGQKTKTDIQFLLHTFGKLVTELLALIIKLESLKQHVDTVFVIRKLICPCDEFHVLDDSKSRIKRRHFRDVTQNLSCLNGLVVHSVYRDASVVF